MFDHSFFCFFRIAVYDNEIIIKTKVLTSEYMYYNKTSLNKVETPDLLIFVLTAKNRGVITVLQMKNEAPITMNNTPATVEIVLLFILSMSILPT